VTELYPFLAVRDVAAAVDFYVRAFGAVEEGERLVAPNGAQVSVLLVAGCHVGVATEAPELGTPSPETVGATNYASSRQRTAAVDGCLWHYNHRRRHSALGHQAPITRTNLLGSYT
jgi:hypothetical protein